MVAYTIMWGHKDCALIVIAMLLRLINCRFIIIIIIMYSSAANAFLSCIVVGEFPTSSSTVSGGAKNAGVKNA